MEKASVPMTTKTIPIVPIQAGNLTFNFMNSGDIRDIQCGNTMLNQVISNSIDGSMNNIYVRMHQDSGIMVVPMLGILSQSRVSFGEARVMWEGEAEGLSYKVVFTLLPTNVWFWDVTVQNEEGKAVTVDIIYAQDMGLADRGAVRTNEAYMSQYIDHKVFNDAARGYVVCSRQNQPQSTGFPYMQQGALLSKAVGFTTDGFQFYGLSYKETNQAEALTQPMLNNVVYQYEYAFTALQTERFELNGDAREARAVFYGLFKETHPAAIEELEYEQDVLAAWEQAEAMPAITEQAAVKVSPAARIGAPLAVQSMTKEELDRYFPARDQEEVVDGELLSFFTDTHEHVVLKEKELRVERPHGHILMTGDNARMNEHVLTTTLYMYGIFNSHIVMGNTNFNKMMTNARNALNVLKTSGQRIYMELDGTFHLLTMPSMFEMGFNYGRWYYKTADDMIIITNFTALDAPELQLQVRSEHGRAYRFLVTNQITMNTNEYEVPFHMEQNGHVLSFRADAAADSAGTLPKLCYRMSVAGADMAVQDETAMSDHAVPGTASLVVLELGSSSEWTMTVQGLLNGDEAKPFKAMDAASEIAAYRAYYETVMNGFRLTHDQASEHPELAKFNSLAWWYTHNMLVHYSVPHGLEQYGGAAWGTRDVCQGPTEYFLATQKYEQVRDILMTVYSNQYEDEGNWPQWFMFDQYSHIKQEESHGDVIVWPLKVLNDYLHATRDFSILEQQVPYSKRHEAGVSEQTATLLDHAKKEIDYIKRNFLHGTHLSSYGDGDWDDTLQPANAQLKKYMISSWTVALTYQVFKQLSEVLQDVDHAAAVELKELAAGICEDYNKYMLSTGVIPGFVYMEEPGEAKLMLHPTDTKTGIQYRLLPMTRSMIAELLTPEQAESHYDLIKRELYCPDGVRLMNRPAQYAGGVSTNFKRAEQAANFGREVGLQYVHAHIRFVEAMAKLGKSDEAWKGLQMINPIGLRDVVPNAELRQSNSYFSSSDGKFNDRYEAQERFHELRNGDVAVKGGWRIYSSGPGIYMNQLISNCLGIRLDGGDLVIDPVLPQSLDGLRFHFMIHGHNVQFEYRLNGQSVTSVTINGQEAAGSVMDNRYRQGGFRIAQQQLTELLTTENNVIVIHM